MRVAAAVLMAGAVMLGGCDRLEALNLPFFDRDGGEGGQADGGLAGASAAPMVEPGMTRRAWTPADPRTQEVTGRLTVSLPDGRTGPLVLAFANGLTYQLVAMGIHLGDDPAGLPDGRTFTALTGAPGETGVFVYRVENERVDRIAPQGGLCGQPAATTFVALSEHVDASGEWALHVTAFRGAGPPGPASAGDPLLCGVYSFDVD